MRQVVVPEGGRKEGSHNVPCLIMRPRRGKSSLWLDFAFASTCGPGCSNPPFYSYFFFPSLATTTHCISSSTLD